MASVDSSSTMAALVDCGSVDGEGEGEGEGSGEGDCDCVAASSNGRFNEGRWGEVATGANVVMGAIGVCASNKDELVERRPPGVWHTLTGEIATDVVVVGNRPMPFKVAALACGAEDARDANAKTGSFKIGTGAASASCVARRECVISSAVNP